jgi:putative hemolysin
MLERYGHLYDLEFIDACIKEFNVSIETHGLERLDTCKKYIVVANHPLGGFDGLVLMKEISGVFRDMKFLVNDLLMNIKNLKGLFIPINKHGKQAAEAVALIEDAYISDAQILTFPAGLVSRKINGRIMDLAWQKSFIQKAVKFQRDVVPVYLSGRNTDFFYRLANIRKFLGIKANLEMFYLVDETWKHKNKHLVLRFGEPIPWNTFDSSKKPIAWAKWVKDKLYSLDGISDVPV